LGSRKIAKKIKEEGYHIEFYQAAFYLKKQQKEQD